MTALLSCGDGASRAILDVRCIFSQIVAVRAGKPEL
jgi:hypothetical protein